MNELETGLGKEIESSVSQRYLALLQEVGGGSTSVSRNIF